MLVCVASVTENDRSNNTSSLNKNNQKALSPKFSQIHIASISTKCFSDGIWVEILLFSVLFIDIENCSCIAHYVL